MPDTKPPDPTTDNPRQNVTFPSNGSTAHGYLATPASGRGPGVVVIQEWWGLVDQIADTAARFAQEGFVALAPDLYGGTTTHDAGEAQELMQQLPVDRAARDLAGAVDYLLGLDSVTGDKVGAVGFCMGGGFVITLANQVGEKVAAAVPFYGVLPGAVPDLSGIKADVLGHYGTDDQMNPVADVKALEQQISDQAGTDVHFEIYEGRGHAFFNEKNLMGTYDKADAEQAWSRTVDFLHSRLG